VRREHIYNRSTASALGKKVVVNLDSDHSRSIDKPRWKIGGGPSPIERSSSQTYLDDFQPDVKPNKIIRCMSTNAFN
jgi:hypothetical protein